QGRGTSLRVYGLENRVNIVSGGRGQIVAYRSAHAHEITLAHGRGGRNVAKAAATYSDHNARESAAPRVRTSERHVAGGRSATDHRERLIEHQPIGQQKVPIRCRPERTVVTDNGRAKPRDATRGCGAKKSLCRRVGVAQAVVRIRSTGAA